MALNVDAPLDLEPTQVGTSMSSESDIRKLLKMRADLEERTEQLQTEIEDLKLAMVEIDKAIVKQGFNQPSPTFQAMKPTELKLEEHKQPVTVTPETITDGSSIQAKDGTILGRVQVDDDKIVFTPREGLTFMTSTPPFQSFLLDRVLANMRTNDETRAATGEITLEQVLSYEVETDGETIRILTVHNYGGERRLREIQSSLRWSLDKMYDKMRRG
ncbi:MAG: hypothetical protein NTY03_11890 [Candidatus Bathyarchaeota archaeon]|jgi:hypothetical protein|nr:hypothetical protein [Candidatus Bathyarchaeota archaeon]